MPLVLILVLFIPAVTWSEVRNPFEPLASRCDSAQLDNWYFAGVLKQSDAYYAMVRSPSGQWLRVREGDVLTDGWQIRAIALAQVTLARGPYCPPFLLVRRTSGEDS